MYVIKSFRHKGIKSLYENGSRRGVQPEHAPKIERILLALDGAATPQELDFPGFRLHPLKGDLKGFWSVTVTANWRVIFRFEGGHACEVDLVDYH